MRRIHHHVTWLGLLVLAGSAAAALNLSQVPPFFVLDGPGFAWFENCSATPSNKLDEYARSQGSLDLWTLRLALQSRARVLQPELARIFLVPTLLGYMSDGKRCLGRTSQQMQQITVLALQQSPFWRLRGASHLIVGGNWWISRTFGRDFIRKILPHTIFVSTMRKAGSEISACWLVAPYVEPPYTRSALPHGVGAGGLDNRPLAFSFVGDLGLVRSRGRPWYYARRADRRAFLTAVASSSHLSSVSAVVHAPNSILLDPTHHAAMVFNAKDAFLPADRPLPNATRLAANALASHSRASLGVHALDAPLQTEASRAETRYCGIRGFVRCSGGTHLDLSASTTASQWARCQSS
eukprot:CAMPEP_0119360380 /NCGR_PEP_ID=MMETSP1334-20130426/8005_1 /TAXON_ID=127549 /ORGANISM="Calcidiscus leptoporus, Strain RCC1130" /LENGTH=351 /DNA_ID=CAMNT_0007375215 /DNA_START=17 /DNA_END=1073 /DNA_ORIENTATION=+